MSEATEASVAGHELLPVPRRSSLKQVALAREILAADLTKDTWTDIFKRAGYSEDTAVSSAKDIRERPGVQRAIEAIRASRLDSAGEIRAKSGAKVLREVSRDDTDPQFALAAWATAAKVQSEYPQEEAGVGDYDRNNAREYIQAIVDRVLLATGCTLDAMSTRQLVDNALVSEPASDNSQYVNSPPPAAGPLQIEAHAVPQKRKRRG